MLTLFYLLLCTTVIYSKDTSFNVSDLLTSTYAKVAKWGASSEVKEEARSNSGQRFYTQSSVADILTGQNLKKNLPSITYSSLSKLDVNKEEELPGKGEVIQIQDRFHPPPYFAINPPSSEETSAEDKPSSESKSPSKTPSIIYGSPIYATPNPPSGPSDSASPPSSFYLPSIDSSNPPSSSEVQVSKPDNLVTYDSPFDSYNPPNSPPIDMGSMNVKPSNSKPPSTLYDSSFDSYNPSMKDNQPDTKPPSASYGSPYDSYSPAGNDKPDDSKPPSSLYNSPYDSYNPPMTNSKPAPSSDSYSKPPDSNNPGGLYDSPYDSYNPPMNNPNSHSHDFGPVYPPHGHPPKDSYLPPTKEKPVNHMHMEDSHDSHPDDGFYSYMPPKKTKKVKLPVHDHSHHMDYSYLPPHHEDHHSDHGPPVVETVDPSAPSDDSEMDHPPKNHDHHDHHNHHEDAPADSAEDLSPPPHYPTLPKYVEKDPHQYDFSDHYPHHHHHIYHEVKTTTTTTPEPPKERVSSSHYSYYYLGRKLWYIPLYFSVYFIVYITLLILKSIARHKVNYVHTYHAKEARSFDANDATAAAMTKIEQAQEKYAMK